MRYVRECAWLRATWKKELKLEGAVLVRRLAWTINKHVEVPEIVIVRDGADARDSVFTSDTTRQAKNDCSFSRLSHQSLSLLDDSLRESHGELSWEGVC